jgi:hypothetical protein
MLQAAPSNIKDFKNGAVVYERFVKPSAVSSAKIALQAVLQDLPGKKPAPPKSYCCDVTDYQREQIPVKDGLLCLGSMKLKNRITLEENHLVFAVCQTEGTRLTCGASHWGDIHQAEVFALLKNTAQKATTEELHRQIEQHFQEKYPFTSFFKDAQRNVIEQVLKGISQTTGEEFSRIFEAQYPAVRGLKYIGAPLPTAFNTVADFVLTSDLKAELEKDPVDINALEELMEDVRTLGLTLNQTEINRVAEKKLLSYAKDFFAAPTDLDIAVKMVEFMNYLEIFGFTPDTVQAQQWVFKGLELLPKEKRDKSILKALARKLKIAL